MKTPAQLTAALRRRASTWSNPEGADQLRRLARETETIVDMGPITSHRT